MGHVLPRRSQLMSTTTDHLIDAAGCASAAVAGGSGQDADVKSMPVSENDRPASRWRSSAALAAEKVRRDALRLMGGDRLRPFRPWLLPVRARPPHRCVGREGALVDREGPDLGAPTLPRRSGY